MGGKWWEWEGICIRGREVRLGSQETVTAKQSTVSYVWMYVYAGVTWVQGIICMMDGL